MHRKRWSDWAVLLVLMALALALRWRYIQQISLFVDEFVTAWAARNVVLRGLPIFPTGNVYPHGLLFTYLVAPFVAGEFHETWARIPGLLVGLAGLPVAYWAGRRLFSSQAGLFAAAVMAVDPDHIIWGARARMYGLLQLLVLLVVCTFYRGLVEDRPRDRYLAMILLVAAVFTHAEAAFLLPVLGLAMLVAWPWRRVWRWSVVLPFALGIVGVVAFYLLAKFGQPGHLETLQESRPYLDLSAQALGVRGLQAFAPVFTRLHRLPLSLLGLIGLYFVFRPRFERSSPLLYLYVVLAGVSALVIVLAGASWERDRYLYMVLPLLFLIAGEVLSRLVGAMHLPSRVQPWIPAILALAVVVFVGLTGSRAAYAQEWGYDLAFRYLRGQFRPPGDRILTSMTTASMLYLDQADAFAIQSGYEEFLVNRPGDGLPADLWTATPALTTTAAFTQALAAAPRTWFVTDGWRFQTRYEPDFIMAVLDHMDLEYDERGAMVFRAEGYTPLAEPVVRRDLRAEFQDQMALTGFGLSSASPAPGDELEIALDWSALAGAGPAYTAFVHLVDENGSRVAGVDEPVLRGLFQPDLWPQEAVFTDRHRLQLSPDLAPGRYRLDVGLYPSGQPEQPLAVNGRERLPLATLVVPALGEAAAPPQPDARSDVDLGEFRLLGYDLEQSEQDGQQEARIALYWQSLAPADRDYKVFVHLVGPDGTIVDQDDVEPGGPAFPTSTWLPGQIVRDDHTLTVPAAVAEGGGTLVVGLYHLPTGERLPAVDAQGNALGDSIVLATLPPASESP